MGPCPAILMRSFSEMLRIPLQGPVGRSFEFPQKRLVQRFCEPLNRDLASSIQSVCLEIKRSYFRRVVSPTLFGVCLIVEVQQQVYWIYVYGVS